MRSQNGRRETALSRVHKCARSERGFSMVESLVTIVIAGIVFATIPFFATALSRTSEDELRVDATNIAQDRIEQTRLLAFADITSANLNSPPSPFGDGRFGTTYTLVGETKPYHIEYDVAAPSASSAKHVTVRVSRAGSNYVTTADTIIQNAAAAGSSTTEVEPTGLTLTVYFDTYQDVDGAGVVLKRLRKGETTPVTIAPVSPPGNFPNASYPEVKFVNLIGGPNYTYSVFCDTSKATYTMAAPPFRLWDSGRLKFDTYPAETEATVLTLRRERRDREAGLTLIEILVSMIILSIVTTMLVAGWVNLQRASANAVSTNNARATVRDAMARVSSELRGAQPTSLPTPIPTLSATATPTPAPPITVAQPMDVQFYSAYNSALASSDGSGVSLTALRLTRIWLDTTTVPPAPWNPEGRTLYLQRDTNSSNTIDAGDRKMCWPGTS